MPHHCGYVPPDLLEFAARTTRELSKDEMWDSFELALLFIGEKESLVIPLPAAVSVGLDVLSPVCRRNSRQSRADLVCALLDQLNTAPRRIQLARAFATLSEKGEIKPSVAGAAVTGLCHDGSSVALSASIFAAMGLKFETTRVNGAVAVGVVDESRPVLHPQV